MRHCGAGRIICQGLAPLLCAACDSVSIFFPYIVASLAGFGFLVPHCGKEDCLLRSLFKGYLAVSFIFVTRSRRTRAARLARASARQGRTDEGDAQLKYIKQQCHNARRQQQSETAHGGGQSHRFVLAISVDVGEGGNDRLANTAAAGGGAGMMEALVCHPLGKPSTSRTDRSLAMNMPC